MLVIGAGIVGLGAARQLLAAGHEVIVLEGRALPPEKMAAIASLGMGVLNKCFLTFPTAFWPTEYDWLEYLSARQAE